MMPTFRSFRWPKRLPQVVVTLALALLLSLTANRVLAQSTSQVSAQISRLESQNALLQSRLSRLEAALSRVGGGGSLNVPSVPPSSNAADASSLASDPLFNRLATLVIELRDRIRVLEERLNIRLSP